MRRLVVVFAFVAGVSFAWVADSAIPLGGIGFHYDGTGIHPAEHKPPTTWDEGEGLTSSSPALCVPKGSKNVRWVVETPNWCYGLPVEVPADGGTGGDPSTPSAHSASSRLREAATAGAAGQGRVFFMCEPGAVGMRWPTLVCLDRKTGKEQWRTEINSFDAKGIQGEERKKLEAQLDEWHDGWRFQYSTLKTWDEWNAMNEADQQAAIQKIKDRWGLDYEPKCPPHNYGWAPFKSDRWGKVRHSLEKVGIIACSWQAFGPDRIGNAFPTPVSDGKAVYVLTHWGIAARVEMDGKIGWYADVGNKVPLCSSPRIYGNQMLVATYPMERALDCATGKVVWEHKTVRTANDNGQYAGVASGIVSRLGETPVYFGPFGDLLRLPDGKLLVSDPILSQLGPHWDQKNSMGFKTIPGKGEGLVGFKVILENDSARIEKVWGIPVAKKGAILRYVVGGFDGIHASVTYGGRYHHHHFIIDSITGDVLAGEDLRPDAPIMDSVTGKVKTPTHEHILKTPVRVDPMPATRMLLQMADGKLYGMNMDNLKSKPYWKDQSLRARGIFQIFSVDGKKLFDGHISNPPFDHPAIQRVHGQGINACFFSFSGSFSIGRDALYVRGVTHLWCLSEK